MEPLIKYPIVPHAWLVNDIDTACQKWHRVTGAGPFSASRDHWGDRHVYRGQEMTVPLDYAFGYHGDTHVQFIQQNHEGDNPQIRRVFEGWKQTHDEWDGHTDLIRGRSGPPVEQ